MSYLVDNKYTIVCRHYLIVVVYVLKFIFFLSICLALTYLWVSLKWTVADDIVNFVIFPVVFMILQYAFLKLVLSLIEYFNHIFIIKWDQIFVINSSLFLKDDIEMIEAYKIIKLDAFCRWFWANFLSFWKIVIELQTKEERSFSFIPHPYELLSKLKEQREFVLENRKKRYIVDDEQINQKN